MSMKKGTRIGERYEIDRPLSNNGGTASVYLGNLIEDSKVKVAIKLSKTDPENKTHEDDLLIREAELIQQADWRHPGIVRLYPVPLNGRESTYFLKALNVPGQPYYVVMEYLEGLSMAENLTKIRKFPLDWKLELFYRLAVTVSFIHQKGYGHRDIKPDNIMFRKPITENTSPEPVLIDFALCSNGNEGSNIVDSSYTLEYAAPERVLKNMYDNFPNYPREADIWSLGVILYEIITGELLFKGNHQRIRTTLINENINILRGDQQLPELIKQFIEGMLSRKPMRRPSINKVLFAFEDIFLPPRLCLAM